MSKVDDSREDVWFGRVLLSVPVPSLTYLGDVPAFLNYPRMEVNEAELPWEQLGFFVFSLVFLFDGHTVFASIPYFYSILCYVWFDSGYSPMSVYGGFCS